MKAFYLLALSLFFFTSSYSQFEKNEKLIGGNLDLSIIREKNPDVTAGGPFGNTANRDTYISIRPEFMYMIGKNTGLSIFGEYLSSINSDVYSNNKFTMKSFGVGLGLTKFKFFTNGFGILGRLQASYSSSWNQFDDTTANVYPKDKYHLTNVSLVPGMFYRFSKHFTLQATIGKISYDHLVSKVQGLDERKFHNQFTMSFTNISFGAFYIFK